MNDEGADATLAKLEIFALCSNQHVLKQVEDAAQETVVAWLKAHGTSIDQLPESRVQQYNEIRRLAAVPEVTHITYPDTIEGTRVGKPWPEHLYVDDAGKYAYAPNQWESRVVSEELAREDLVGWLRNPDRKDWSLCVPYNMGGEDLPLYPDFLIVRSVDGKLTVDILDPHTISLADAPYKAAGLARYAEKHWHQFGRIELIIIEDDAIKRLELTDERVRDRVKGVETREHLRQLFDLT